jgi:glycine cleavage system regulatory protein
MHHHVPLVVTVLGRDRPGIVQDLARIVAEAGGNWEQSNLVRLAGRFAGVVQVSAPDERGAERIGSSLRALKELQVVVDRGELVEASGQAVQIAITATDRPGIVRDLTRILLDRGVNIVALTTCRSEAPMAGGSLFEVRVDGRMDPSWIGRLRADLEELQDDLQLEVH